MVQPDQSWQLKLVRLDQKWFGVIDSARMSPALSMIVTKLNM